MTDPFLMIKNNTQVELVIKKSRFICTIQRAHSEDEALQIIQQVSDQNRKANHNCFAYLIGDHDEIQRESDNGEPSGTAGVPILESLQLAKLHNVIAIVTRYFGGIKLGAGGLIRAYSNVTTKAVHQAGLIERVLQSTINITSTYAQHDQLLYFLKEHQLTVGNEEYGVNVTTEVFINQTELSAIIDQLTNLFNDQLQIEQGEDRYNEIPYNK